MSPRTRTALPRELPEAADFLALWKRIVGPDAFVLPSRRGRKPRVPVDELLPALIFHVMQQAGTLATHQATLCAAPLVDSSWADRRQRWPWTLFVEVLRRALRPLATLRRQPDAFWAGYRLVALDGTQFNLQNTPQITAVRAKAATRRGRAAFAKLPVVVLLELGLHNPLAAAVGRQGESEWALAQTLIPQLPRRALLLGDRLYGLPAFVTAITPRCTTVGSHFLLRVPRYVTAPVQRRCRDGSRLIAVAPRQPGGRLAGPAVVVREIRAQVARPGHRPHTLRLWTSLLDPTAAPARTLVEIYATRWEHELYFRELKRQLRKTALLQSHTVETAAQELAALIIATAVLARVRLHAAPVGVPVRRIPFARVLEIVRGWWIFFGAGQALFSAADHRALVQRGYDLLLHQRSPPRRDRSCARGLRQPIKPWPRVLQPRATTGPYTVTIDRSL
jgi:hypothetical protein